MDNTQISYREILLATGTTWLIEEEGVDSIELIETVIPITDGVVLNVANREVADLNFGNGERIELKFTEEIAEAFVNIDVIKPLELLATIARHSGVYV